MPDASPKERKCAILLGIICRSLFEQIKANQERLEEEHSERRKHMYGLRPMDDEEYEDYRLMAISKRRREEEDRDRLNREEVVFSKC